MENVEAGLPYELFPLQLHADSDTDIPGAPAIIIFEEYSWRDWLFLTNYMDHIIQFVMFLWENFNFYNTIFIFLKYVPTIIYAYKTIHSLYKTSYERRLKVKMQITEMDSKVQLLQQKVEQQKAEVAEKRGELKARTEAFIGLRRRVRELVTGSSALRVYLRDVVVCGDQPTTAIGEDTALVGELLQELQYDQEIFEEQKIVKKIDLHKFPKNGYRCSPPGTPASTLPSESSRSSGERRGGGGGGEEGSRFRVVKVTNIYKVACTRTRKQKRKQRLSKNVLLERKNWLSLVFLQENIYCLFTHGFCGGFCEHLSRRFVRCAANIIRLGRTWSKRSAIGPSWAEPRDMFARITGETIDSIKKLLQGWHKSLNTAVNRKLANVSHQPEIPMPPVEINYGVYTKMNYREVSESDSDALNSNDADMHYDNYRYGWLEYPYQMPMYNISDPETLMGLNLQSVYAQPHCVCNGPQGSKVLFNLPVATNSQYDMENQELSTD